jgi:hypothetical protein
MLNALETEVRRWHSNSIGSMRNNDILEGKTVSRVAHPMLKTSFRKYLVVLAVTLLAFFLFPLPLGYIQAVRQYDLMPKLTTKSDTIIFGASTIDAVSQCDKDQRSIAEMLASKARKPVVDGSFLGQSMEQSVNFAALITKIRDLNEVVITSGWAELSEPGNLSLHDYISLRELNATLQFDSPLQYFHGANLISSPLAQADRPFVYKGIPYPGVSGFQNELFFPERAARTCPENDGHNPQYIEAIYFHRMIEHAPDASNTRLLISLHDYLQSMRKSMVFMMMPLNFEKLGQMDPEWPALVRQRRDGFLNQLRAGGIAVLDLSEGLPNQSFKDRWCGCTHYTEVGRMFVAEKLAQFLASRAVVADRT